MKNIKFHSQARCTDLSLCRVWTSKELYGTIGISRRSLRILSDRPSLIRISNSHSAGLRPRGMRQFETTTHAARYRHSTSSAQLSSPSIHRNDSLIIYTSLGLVACASLRRPHTQLDIDTAPAQLSSAHLLYTVMIH